MILEASYTAVHEAPHQMEPLRGLFGFTLYASWKRLALLLLFVLVDTGRNDDIFTDKKGGVAP
jgi:hypothetical protein